MRKITHSVYVVAWPSTHVVKAGYTSGKRWRKFLACGAELVSLSEHPSVEHAIDHEVALETALSERGERAFSDRQASLSHVGSGGCGWSECYRMAPEDYAATLRFLRSESPMDSDRSAHRTPDLTRPDQT